MKLSFTVVGSSMLFAISHAHMTMVEPRWNFGAADTSMCGMNAKKEVAGAHTTGDFAQYQNASNEVKSLMKCSWKENRQDYWFNTGTQIGCPVVTGQICAEVGVEGHTAPCCDDPMEPTLTSPDLLSFPGDVNATGNNRYNPWNAPGHAPVIDPCGVVGGFPWENPDLYLGGPETFGSSEPCKEGCSINGASAPEDMQFKAGTMGSEVMHKALTNPDGAKAKGEEQPVTQWAAGGVAEVAQGALLANHGGGYQWRLCPAAEFTTDGTKNEECFQRLPLEYASDKSSIQFGDQHRARNTTGGRRFEFDAVRVTDANTDGVMPKGSAWTKFPIPTCCDVNCEHPSYLHGKPLGLNFPAPAEGAYGFGAADFHARGTVFFSGANADEIPEVVRETKDQYDFTVADTVKVPEKEGRYVLSWRWDAEQTPQVWSNCALVDIVQESKNRPSRALRGAARN
jgi:hypothetical protein